MNEFDHIPVLRKEVLSELRLVPDGVYVDATFGRGGHAGAILTLLGQAGRLICVDQDSEAIAFGQKTYGSDPRVVFLPVNFAKLKPEIEKLGLLGKVSGILLDLGVSSPQLEDGERGFSFQQDGPLDMRMDLTSPLTAADWISQADVQEIIWVLKTYGEERFANRIAHRIVKARDEAPITSTLALANVVKKSVPQPKSGKHPATKTFQAIRIHINEELSVLEKVLEDTLDILRPGGRLCVISFHSLEAQAVKRFVRRHSVSLIPKEVPIQASEIILKLNPKVKKILPTKEEVENNPRARSAVLRIIEKAN